MTSATTEYKYVGDGEFVQGVPARHLSHDDMQLLDREQRDAVRHSPLYERVQADPGPEAKHEPEPEPEPKPDAKPETKRKTADTA